MAFLKCKQAFRRSTWKKGMIIQTLLLFSFCVHAQNPILFEEDFENGLGGFQIDNSFGDGNGLWHLSASCLVPLTGHTNGFAFRYGRESHCDYNNGEANQGVVYSPQIDLTDYPHGSAVELHFMYYLDTEKYSAERDLASVEITQNDVIYVIIAHKYSRPNAVLLTNKTTEWTECIVDLSDYAGATIRLRFGLETYDKFQNDFGGFYIDDIVVYGPPCDYTIAGDTNKDCVVNMADLAAIAENWLLNCHLTPDDPGCVPD